MNLSVQEMLPQELELVIDYFHDATPEHLEMLGVDPTRLPSASVWRERYAMEYSRPVEQRAALVLIWKLDNAPIGFSSADKIKFGSHANMHLHILKSEDRRSGCGTACVVKSAQLYFAMLKLERLFCEPNAFNVGPNRTLQRAGFKYLKTHNTVPGPLNFHQAVTRWVLERDK
ncbi:MAG: GNAT family N-acetyltransferase [Gammaproteobacteria bacterium RIFCSPLOWO2_02_FULL_57_10]|nr:MAG: GNAT family N-acetyltransferase [Gammaproteobacteria bacterium RIFCSPLOWO2_02_FULL_57_10]